MSGIIKTKQGNAVRKIVSGLFAIAAVMFIMSASVWADGWLNRAGSVSYGTMYRDGYSPTDFSRVNSSTFYKAYRLAVPAKGQVRIHMQTPESRYLGGHMVYARMFLYSNSNLSRPALELPLTSDGYNSAGDLYYWSRSYTLTKGTWYCVFEFTQYVQGTSYYIDFSYSPAFASTGISKLTRGKKCFTVKYRKASGCTGYQIRYSRKSNMASAKTVTVSGASKVSRRISKLKAGKYYYVQVRSLKRIKLNGRYVTYAAPWSAGVRVKTK